MRFTLKQISYFVATAETGSITLASEKVNISQPSISSAITALEEEFGIQLFIRHHAQGLSLTAEGQRFLREAKALLLQAEEVQSAASMISAKVGGLLEVGCLSTLFPLAIPELLSVFRKRYDAAKVNAVAGNQAELFEALRHGRIALLLTYDMNIPADFDFTPMAPLPPYAFVGDSASFRAAAFHQPEGVGGGGFSAARSADEPGLFSVFIPRGGGVTAYRRALRLYRCHPQPGGARGGIWAGQCAAEESFHAGRA